MAQDAGTAGNTNYRHWDKVTADLVQDVETEEQLEKEKTAKALGLDGKYARSHAEAEERKKAKEARKARKVLDRYQKRELGGMQTFTGLLDDKMKEAGEDQHHNAVVYMTRDMLDAGKRVINICDTKGRSTSDHIILTQDLSHLESKMASNAMAIDYSGDNVDKDDDGETPETRSVFGVIKLFLQEVHNCTIILRCKLISGTVEMSYCSNVVVKMEKETTVATVQADLCENITIEFHDAPSGKNTAIAGHEPTLYWGDDTNDRIFHAGVTNMRVVLYRDGFIDMETTMDYLKDGATAVGNATAEEMQFVTFVIEGELKTEKVVRHGATTGANARPMTQRELDEEREKREKAVDMAMEKAIRFEEKGEAKRVVTMKKEEVDNDVEEVYTSMSKSEIEAILHECEVNKARGNEAFAAGEYAQAILLYSLALDKADELPDKGSQKQLFPRHVCFANRSASFLKMGDFDRALADATRAKEIDPTYVKGIFRKGLALHAMGRYEEAIKVLAEASKLEPKNKQIKQALQFAEIRMTQEMRKRME